MIIDGQQTVNVLRCYTPFTLLAIAGMTDTARAVHIKAMKHQCDATVDGSHPLCRGSVATTYANVDAPANAVRIITIVCVACGRYGNTEARNVPGTTAITS